MDIICQYFQSFPKKFLHSRKIVKKLSPYLTQAEGFITGVGAKMFTIAGPVIVYGTEASVVYGFVYWLSTRL